MKGAVILVHIRSLPELARTDYPLNDVFPLFLVGVLLSKESKLNRDYILRRTNRNLDF